jgi:hypothetical protein
MLNSYSTWPGLAQVYRLERQFQWWRSGRCYRTSNEVEFGITSLSRKKITPDRLLCFRRQHWGIETGLHYRRDVTFKEDATRMTIGNTGKIMASINNLVIAFISQANFQNAAQARRWSLLISRRLLPCSPPLFPDFGKAMPKYLPSLDILSIPQIITSINL